MIKDRNEKPVRGIEIDLSGPDGNAFSLMGYANRLADQLGLNSDEIISKSPEVILLDESNAECEIGTVIVDYYLSFNKNSEYVYKTKTDCYGFSIRQKNRKSVI